MNKFQAEKPTRGDIYWIQPSPYRGNGQNTLRAGRPGIIVSNDTLNDNEFNYEVVYLTTTPKNDFPEHCTIRSSQKVSTAMCDQIQTVSHEQIGSYIGTVTADEMANIERCMMISLGLDVQPSKERSVGELTEAGTEELHRVTAELEKARIEQAKAQGREELIMKMYNDLLAKTMRKKRESKE